MTLTPELALVLVTLGLLPGTVLGWAVTTWVTTREPHCLDCECPGCELVRELTDPSSRTAEELEEAWRKVRRAA